MIEQTATIAERSVGGLAKLGNRPGGGTARGTLDSGTTCGNSEDILFGFKSNLIKEGTLGKLVAQSRVRSGNEGNERIFDTIQYDFSMSYRGPR